MNWYIDPLHTHIHAHALTCIHTHTRTLTYGPAYTQTHTHARTHAHREQRRNLFIHFYSVLITGCTHPSLFLTVFLFFFPIKSLFSIPCHARQFPTKKPIGPFDLYSSSIETSLEGLPAVSSWQSRLTRTLTLWLCSKTNACASLAADKNVHRCWPNPPTWERKRIHILEWAACGEEWPLFLSLLCNLERVISSPQLRGSVQTHLRSLLTGMFSGSHVNQNPKELKCQWAILSAHGHPLRPLSRCGASPSTLSSFQLSTLSQPLPSLLLPPHRNPQSPPQVN